MQFKSSLLVCICLAGLAWAQAALAQGSSACKAACETDKGQCRTGANQGDAAAALTAAGVVALALDQPKLFQTPSSLDNKRDMRDVLEARRRAEDETKVARRELDDKCNRSFMQCIGTCLDNATRDKAATPQ